MFRSLKFKRNRILQRLAVVVVMMSLWYRGMVGGQLCRIAAVSVDGSMMDVKRRELVRIGYEGSCQSQRQCQGIGRDFHCGSGWFRCNTKVAISIQSLACVMGISLFIDKEAVQKEVCACVCCVPIGYLQNLK